jgi:glycosyltransferase involved in cell wall biosynthesis
MSEPWVSFIIPAYNEAKLLPSTLHGIAQALGSWDEPWELIVCDNDSTDETAELARSSGARVIHEPIRQIARSRNAGASIAKGQWFVFIDADSIPSQALLNDLRETLKGDQVVGGGATLCLDRALPAFWMMWVHAWNGISRCFRLAAGSFVYCRAEAFRETGGFPQDCYTGEEIWFSRKLKAWGRKHRMPFKVLHRHPLMTSARKVSLYSRGELLKTLICSMFLYPFVRHRRQAWFMWYDGRR